MVTKNEEKITGTAQSIYAMSVSHCLLIYLQDALSPLDVSGKGHVDRAIAVRLFSRVRPPGINVVVVVVAVLRPQFIY